MILFCFFYINWWMCVIRPSVQKFSFNEQGSLQFRYSYDIQMTMLLLQNNSAMWRHGCWAVISCLSIRLSARQVTETYLNLVASIVKPIKKLNDGLYKIFSSRDDCDSFQLYCHRTCITTYTSKDHSQHYLKQKKNQKWYLIKVLLNIHENLLREHLN